MHAKNDMITRLHNALEKSKSTAKNRSSHAKHPSLAALDRKLSLPIIRSEQKTFL